MDQVSISGLPFPRHQTMHAIDDVVNFKIYIRSSRAMADREKKREERNIKTKDLANKKNFLDKIKRLFIIFKGYHLLKTGIRLEGSQLPTTFS